MAVQDWRANPCGPVHPGNIYCHDHGEGGGGVGGWVGGGGAHTLIKTGIQTGAKQPVPGVQAAPCNPTGTLSDFRGRAYSWDVHVPMIRWLCVAM